MAFGPSSWNMSVMFTKEERLFETSRRVNKSAQSPARYFETSKQKTASCKRPIKDLISGTDVHCLYWYYIELQLMISSKVTQWMLMNCYHCFQPPDSIPLCLPSGISVPVDLCLYNHMSISAASASHFLSPFSQKFLYLFCYLLFLTPTLALRLISLSLGLFTVEHSSPIWSE